MVKGRYTHVMLRYDKLHILKLYTKRSHRCQQELMFEIVHDNHFVICTYCFIIYHLCYVSLLLLFTTFTRYVNTHTYIQNNNLKVHWPWVSYRMIVRSRSYILQQILLSIVYRTMYTERAQRMRNNFMPEVSRNVH